MYWLQFQTRVRKDVTEGADEPTTYFLPTDNLADLFYFDVEEKISLFALLLFLLHLMKHCNVKSVACIASGPSVAHQLLQTPLVVLIDIYLEVMRKNTGSTSNGYFEHALLDKSQSPNFSWDRRYIARLTV